MLEEVFTTKRKALKINLDSKIYGTLAEIGGGQEVARAFFQAGGASGTIAKSISAYDKTFSDMFYNDNKQGRHVSEDRLKKMLKKEFNELIQVLSDKKDYDTRFFAFADTVETLNYKKTNKGHGWLGVRFQLSPFSEPNQVIIHVNLKENDALLQQYTLGALGVNLIYACFHYYNYPNKFLTSLLDNLDTDRVEIDMAHMQGPELDYVDNRLLSVQLVKNGMTEAVVFDNSGDIKQASDMFYKKNVMAFRGSFRPITKTGCDIIRSSKKLFEKDENYKPDNTISICEITLQNLMNLGEFDERDFLERVNILNGLGQHVMVSNFREYYKLSDFFSRFKINQLRLIMGVPALNNILNVKYYEQLSGGILEAFGRLFKKNVKLYVYPAKESDKLVTCNDLQLDDNVKLLFDFVKKNKLIMQLSPIDENNMGISSRVILEKIRNNDNSWENDVPEFVAEVIKKKRLFGYKKTD